MTPFIRTQSISISRDSVCLCQSSKTLKDMNDNYVLSFNEIPHLVTLLSLLDIRWSCIVPVNSVHDSNLN